MKKEKDFKSIGAKIKYYRLKKGLSQEQLGELSHSSIATIRAIERGVNTPSVDTLIMIADALEITADDILENVLEFPHSSSIVEANSILKDCNHDELEMLIRIIKFLKNLFIEFGI